MFSPARLERLLFVLIALLLVILAFVLYYRIQELSDSYRLVSRTYEVQQRLEETFSYTKEAETSQRGFLLTKDSAFLPNYYASHKKILELLKQLRKDTKYNEKQQVNLNTLEYLIRHRFDRMNFVLANRDSITDQGLGGYSLGVLHGRSVMDSIRYHVNNMMTEEKRLLKEREELSEEYKSIAPKTVLVTVLFALAMLLFSFYRINRQLKLKAHYAKLLSDKNDELLSKNQQLEKINEELSSFNYITSHDLREPLRKIKTFNSLIVQDKNLSDESRHYIERVHRITNHMQSLLDDLLAYSTISNEERQMLPIDLNELMIEVKENLSDLIEENKATIHYENLPVIKGIHFQLEHLFENMISNSIKYKQSEIPPQIIITAQKISNNELPNNVHSIHDAFIRIDVADNGTGFDEKYADKVFELFQRLHEKTENSGTGIGLAICRKVVHNHDGFITVKSQINKGTTFSVYLPNLLHEPVIE